MTVSASAQRLFDATGPLNDHDPDNGGVALALCAAAADMLQGLDIIAADSADGPGWSSVLDPVRAPASWLGWQADLYGVPLVVGSSEQDQRDTISDLPPQQRGTPAAMRAAVEKTLAAGGTARALERTISAYTMTVVTRTADTTDAAASEAAARAQKPGGIVLTYVVSDAPLIDDGTRTIDASAGVIDTATLADIT